MATHAPNADPFVERFELRPRGTGVLDGLRFAVKDIIDVQGHITGGGNLGSVHVLVRRPWAGRGPGPGRSDDPIARRATPSNRRPGRGRGVGHTRSS